MRTTSFGQSKIDNGKNARGKKKRTGRRTTGADRRRTYRTRTFALRGPNIDQTHLTTVTYIELLRLKREFLNAVASARDAFPLQQERLKVFQRQMDAAVLNQSKDRLDFLRAELDILLGELMNPR